MIKKGLAVFLISNILFSMATVNCKTLNTEIENTRLINTISHEGIQYGSISDPNTNESMGTAIIPSTLSIEYNQIYTLERTETETCFNVLTFRPCFKGEEAILYK